MNQTSKLLEGILPKLKKVNGYLLKGLDKDGDIVNSVPLQSVVDILVDEYDEIDEREIEKDSLEETIQCLQLIYNDSNFESPISDDDYDKLYERYKDVFGKDFVGSKFTPVNNGSDKKWTVHNYPHLRGSLDKAHYIRKKDVPSNDKRKSIEEFLDKIPNIENRTVHVVDTFKDDGISAVFEFDKYQNIIQVVTRGDVDENTGLDITHMFEGRSFRSLFACTLGDLNVTSKFAVKSELIVARESFEEYNIDHIYHNKPLNNPRSMASSIINCEEHRPDMYNYLFPIPLEVSSEDMIYFENTHKEYSEKYINMIDGFHEWIIVDNHFTHEYTLDKEGILNFLESRNIADVAQQTAEELGLPIDGVVITILDQPLIEFLGRSDHINKFQIALKFPAGEKKAILKDVKFQVGLIGTITPVAVIEPIVIMGNTITNIGLSSINKMEKLDLSVGDEVLIKYDIIPKIYKTKDCKAGTGERIRAITHCPKCNEQLKADGLIVRCVNEECPSRIVGKIQNFTNKLDIKHISVAIITDWVENGIIESISDLYRLEELKHKILQIKGYKEGIVNKIIRSVELKKSLFPHELLGSIGIPNVGRTIMEKVCTEIPFYELIEQTDFITDRLSDINGIGRITAARISNGIYHNRKLINELLKYVKIKPYVQKTYDCKVVFTKVRDKQFEEFLDDIGVLVQPSYRKDTDIVVCESLSVSSSKVDKARKDGKYIMSMDQAKRYFGYK